MNVKFYICDNFACGHIRGIVPAAELNRRGRVRVDVKSDVLYCDRPGTDVMVFQRQHREQMLMAQQLARESGIVTVYDLDDDLLNIISAPGFEAIAKGFQQEKVRENLKRFMESVDCVVCSVPELEESIRAQVPGVRATTVIPNALDLAAWDEARIIRLRELPGRDPERVVIGWYGSHSHTADAPEVGPVLSALMAKHPGVHLALMGRVMPEHLGVDLKHFGARVSCVPWVNISQLPFAIQHFDIGLACIKDNAFNRSRSNVKWLEMSALEIPTVASAMPCYTSSIRHGEDGFIAKDEQGWFDALEALIMDRELRLGIGRTARASLERDWSIQRMAPRWERMYREVVNGVDFN